MTFIVLIGVAPGLRGHVTRWLSEVAAGVFVGNPSARVRERLWRLLAERVGDGQAVMVEPFDNEQGWAVRTAGRDRYVPVDLMGLVRQAFLIARSDAGQGVVRLSRSLVSTVLARPDVRGLDTPRA